ncbi:MAG: hypothetical protein J7L15_00595 [Clostridiales bacterium]|nr:hypothetical protein [Clostridiales bacterium]
METIRTLGLSIMLFVGLYIAIVLSWMLVPVTIFLFVFFAVRTMKGVEKEFS